MTGTVEGSLWSSIQMVRLHCSVSEPRSSWFAKKRPTDSDPLQFRCRLSGYFLYHGPTRNDSSLLSLDDNDHTEQSTSMYFKCVHRQNLLWELTFSCDVGWRGWPLFNASIPQLGLRRENRQSNALQIEIMFVEHIHFVLALVASYDGLVSISLPLPDIRIHLVDFSINHLFILRFTWPMSSGNRPKSFFRFSNRKNHGNQPKNAQKWPIAET